VRRVVFQGMLFVLLSLGLYAGMVGPWGPEQEMIRQHPIAVVEE
jgi:hypothetical protein